MYYEPDPEFLKWFNKTFVDGIEYSWKDGKKKWHELPEGFKALTFTVALHDYHKAKREGKNIEPDEIWL